MLFLLRQTAAEAPPVARVDPSVWFVLVVCVHRGGAAAGVGLFTFTPSTNRTMFKHEAAWSGNMCLLMCQYPCAADSYRTGDVQELTVCDVSSVLDLKNIKVKVIN